MCSKKWFEIEISILNFKFFSISIQIFNYENKIFHPKFEMKSNFHCKAIYDEHFCDITFFVPKSWDDIFDPNFHFIIVFYDNFLQSFENEVIS